MHKHGYGFQTKYADSIHLINQEGIHEDHQLNIYFTQKENQAHK